MSAHRRLLPLPNDIRRTGLGTSPRAGSLSLHRMRGEGRGEGLRAAALVAAPLIRPTAIFSPPPRKGEGVKRIAAAGLPPVQPLLSVGRGLLPRGAGLLSAGQAGLRCGEPGLRHGPPPLRRGVPLLPSDGALLPFGWALLCAPTGFPDGCYAVSGGGWSKRDSFSRLAALRPRASGRGAEAVETAPASFVRVTGLKPGANGRCERPTHFALMPGLDSPARPGCPVSEIACHRFASADVR